MSLNVDTLRSLLIAINKEDYGILKSQIEFDSSEEKDLVSRYPIYLFVSLSFSCGSYVSILGWISCDQNFFGKAYLYWFSSLTKKNT